MNTHQTEFRRSEVADAAACPLREIWAERYTPGLEPLRPATKGVPDSSRYSLMQSLAIRTARLLHTKFGVDPRNMRDLVSRLWFITDSELRREFSAGRTCVVVVGRSACLELFPPDSVSDVSAYLRSKGVKADVYAISLEHELSQLLERLMPPAELN